MKYPEIKHTFIIDEDRWSHGTKEEYFEDNRLKIQNDEETTNNGKMCCLGFFSRSCGVKARDLINTGSLVDIPENCRTKKLHELIFESDYDSNYKITDYYELTVVSELIDANDNSGLTLSERKNKIKRLFRSIGVDVQFKSSKNKK